MTAATIYLIVGPPRSGTSVLTQVFKEQGIPMYFAATAPDLDSPSGNQEDNLVRLLNNSLMGVNGIGKRRDWDNPKYVDASSAKTTRLIRAYVAARSRHASGLQWGVKDPRLCFLLEPWHAATIGLPISWIFIRRLNREASIRSLMQMLPATLRHANDAVALYRLASSWLESYLLAAELGFQRTGIKPYQFAYEELLTPGGQCALINHFRFDKPISCVNVKWNRQGKSNNLQHL